MEHDQYGKNTVVDDGGANMDPSLAMLAFAKAPVGLVLTEDRVIRTCNDTFAQMFGFRPRELLDQSFRILYPNRQAFDNIRDIGIAPLRQSGIYSDERLVHHRSGNQFWCRFRAVTLTPERPLERTILSFAQLSDQTPVVSLSRRERQLVVFLSHGLTSKEIAQRLELSPRTIEDYRARLRRKLGAKNTSEVLSHLLRLDG